MKLKCDEPLSNGAFYFSVRCYTMGTAGMGGAGVRGRHPVDSSAARAAKAAALAENEHEHYVADVDAMLAEFMGVTDEAHDRPGRTHLHFSAQTEPLWVTDATATVHFSAPTEMIVLMTLPE